MSSSKAGIQYPVTKNGVGDIEGFVSGLKGGVELLGDAPTTGEVLTYNGTTAEWTAGPAGPVISMGANGGVIIKTNTVAGNDLIPLIPAASLVGGVLQYTYNSGTRLQVTLPNGTAIDAAIPLAGRFVGATFDCIISAPLSSSGIQISSNTDINLIGVTVTTTPLTWRLTFRRTGLNTWDVFTLTG